jgi:hypothetical protein
MQRRGSAEASFADLEEIAKAAGVNLVLGNDGVDSGSDDGGPAPL